MLLLTILCFVCFCLSLYLYLLLHANKARPWHEGEQKHGRMPEIWFEGCVDHQLFMHLHTVLLQIQIRLKIQIQIHQLFMHLHTALYCYKYVWKYKSNNHLCIWTMHCILNCTNTNALYRRRSIIWASTASRGSINYTSTLPAICTNCTVVTRMFAFFYKLDFRRSI